MHFREFTALVFRMREAQKAYFRTRHVQDLRESKDWERRVDRAVEEILTPPSTLFCEENDLEIVPEAPDGPPKSP